MSTFEDILTRDGRLVFSTVGKSMLPLIREGKDLVVICPAPSALKRNDVILYKRNDGQYVLHRIVAIRSDGLVTRGDNCCSKECHIQIGQVVGILQAVMKNGREILADSWQFKLFAIVWMVSFPVRWFTLKICSTSRKIKVTKRPRGVR